MKPGLIILAGVGLATLYKPLGELAAVSPETIFDPAYWKVVLTAGVSSFADAGKLGIGMIAGAYGIPLLAKGIETVRASNAANSPGA